MIRIALLTTSIALGLSAAASVEAQGMGPRGDWPDFATLDADGDGALTQAEIDAFREGRAADRFARIDTDGDGAISPEEMRAAPGAQFAARMLERFDSDGDGLLSADELASGADMRRGAGFGWLDADDDGVVSEEEFAGMHESMEERMHGAHGGRGDRGGHEGRGHGWFGGGAGRH